MERSPEAGKINKRTVTAGKESYFKVIRLEKRKDGRNTHLKDVFQKMGIKGLFQFLRGVTADAHLSRYEGKKISVDVSCYLYKGAFACAEKLGLGISTDE